MRRDICRMKMETDHKRNEQKDLLLELESKQADKERFCKDEPREPEYHAPIVDQKRELLERGGPVDFAIHRQF